MDKKKLEQELVKLEEELAPTAEMQLGETDVLQLVKDTDFGGRSTAGFAGKVMLVVGLAWVAFQMWYASPIPFSLPAGFRSACSTTRKRARYTSRSACSLLSWRFLHSSVRRVITFHGRTGCSPLSARRRRST